MPRNTSKMADASLPARLLIEAERLYGWHGLDGVSLRQICTAAGTKNNYAVQYHFGDSESLIRGIIAARTPAFELARAGLLSKLGPSGTHNTRDLLEVFHRPLCDTLDAGEPIAARFMLALHTSPDGWRPLAEAYGQMPISQRIVELLAETNPAIPIRVIWQRLRRVSIMILATVCHADTDKKFHEFRKAMLEDAFDMSAAGFAVPVGEGRDILVQEGDKYFSRS